MSTQAKISTSQMSRVTPKSPSHVFLLAGGAFVLMVIASICFMPKWEGSFWLPAVICTLLSMGMMGRAVWIQSAVDPLQTHDTHTLTEARFTRHDLMMTGVGIAVLGTLTGLQFVPNIPEQLQIALLLVAMPMLVAGMAGLRKQHIRNLWAAWRTTPLWIWLILGHIFLFALALRLWILESGLRVLVDEMQNITPIVRMWEYNYPLLQQIYYPDYPYTYLYAYMQQIGGAIFGHTLFTLRIPNAVYGALSIFAIYWLANLLFENRQIALLSATALAVFPMHIQFSRIGIMNLYDPTLAMLAFAFAIRGVRYGLRRDWVLAGTMLGFTHYVYEGGRLLHTPLMSLWLFLLVLWMWKQANPKRVARGLAWALLMSVLISAPIYITWVGMDSVVFGRFSSEKLKRVELGDDLETIDISPQAQVLQNVVDTFALYVTKLDEWMFYGGKQPIIPTFLQPFFLLGLAASIGQRRRWGYAMLPALWLLVTIMLLGLLIWNPLHAARHTVAMPAMAIIIALGIYWLTRLLFNSWQYHLTFAWIIMIVLGVSQVVYYFQFHLPTYNYQARWVRGYADPDDAVLRAAELPYNTEVYIITEQEEFPLWQPENFLIYLTRNRTPIIHVWLEPWVWGDVLTDLNPTKNHAFFVESYNSDLIQQIVSLHPNVEPSFSKDPYISADQQFILLYLTSDKVLPRSPQAQSR